MDDPVSVPPPIEPSETSQATPARFNVGWFGRMFSLLSLVALMSLFLLRPG